MRYFMVIVNTLLSVPALAQKADVSQIDAILDRLERRLLDQEAEGLSFEEKKALKPSLTDKTPITTYQYEKTKIEANNPNELRLREVTNLINELEQQVDQLASSVQKTKQAILDDAAINNFVTIEATIPDTDLAAIKSILVKLDGFKLYSIEDSAGLWLPLKSMPLYAGPLQPGNHRLDIEARISIREATTLVVNSPVYRFVNKSFQWTVPESQASVRYVLTLLPPTKIDGQADAKLEEVP